MTNQNLLASQGEIKAVVASCDGTATAKLIAVLKAAGVTRHAEIAQLLGMSERGVRKAVFETPALSNRGEAA